MLQRALTSSNIKKYFCYVIKNGSRPQNISKCQSPHLNPILPFQSCFFIFSSVLSLHYLLGLDEELIWPSLPAKDSGPCMSEKCSSQLAWESALWGYSKENAWLSGMIFSSLYNLVSANLLQKSAISDCKFSSGGTLMGPAVSSLSMPLWMQLITVY